MSHTTRITRPILGAVVCGVMAALAWCAPAAASSKSLNLVALGDSYSAGVGLGRVSSGCDRDKGAYAPHAVKRRLSKGKPKVKLDDFAACSGAKIADVQSRQLKAVDKSTDIVTITIGGNDIGFGTKALTCALRLCDPSIFTLQPDFFGGQSQWDELHDRLAATYAAVRNRMSPRGHVYVLTYPIPFSRRQSLLMCWSFDFVAQNAANALVGRLDDTIYWATKRADQLVAESSSRRPGNVHLVDWRSGTRVTGGYVNLEGAFDTWTSDVGHCNWGANRDVLLNGPVVLPPTDVNNSFHPNAVGYQYASKRLADAIKQHQR